MDVAFTGEQEHLRAAVRSQMQKDASAIRTTAVRDGDDYIVNGEKVVCSGAGVDNAIISLYCRTDSEAPHRTGLSCLLLDNRTPGLTIRPMKRFGRHMFPTAQLFLDDVRIPATSLLGQEHRGWDIMLASLQLERLVTSAAYVGNATAVAEEALAYSKQREQFGRRIGDFQAIAHLLADMATEVETARYLTYYTAWKMEQGEDALTEVCMSKLFGSEMFLRVANGGMQVIGGYGYTMEVPMQPHLRAARGAPITAGTSQMQRDTIAQRLELRPR